MVMNLAHDTEENQSNGSRMRNNRKLMHESNDAAILLELAICIHLFPWFMLRPKIYKIAMR